MVAVEAADRADHHLRRHPAHTQAMSGFVVAGEAVVGGDALGQPLGGVVQRWEAVAAGGEEAAGLGHRIGVGVAPGVALRAPVGQGELLLLVGGVEAQESLRDAGEVGADVAGLKRRQVDVGEDRILQRRLQPRDLVRSAIAGQGRQVERVGLGQPQQHLGRQRPVISLQEGDVGRGDFQVGGHVCLGQAAVAPEPSKAGANVKPAVAGHASRSSVVSPYNMTDKFCKV